MTFDRDFYTVAELGQMLGRSVRTPNRWHKLDKGPARTKIGTLIVYRRSVVSEWLNVNELGGERS